MHFIVELIENRLDAYPPQPGEKAQVGFIIRTAVALRGCHVLFDPVSGLIGVKASKLNYFETCRGYN